MAKVRLDAITFDAGTQVRAALDQDHVAVLTEVMRDGVTVPPIVLFHDGSAHYIADGFHRFMAASRLQWREIDAHVQPGGKADALWFALGANRNQHALRMSSADKRHAILLALQTWPEKSQTMIAEQVGCAQSYVTKIKQEAQVITSDSLPRRSTGKDGKSYPATKPQASRIPPERAAEVVDRLKAGEGVTAIAAAMKMNTSTVQKIRTSAGLPQKVDRSREGVAQRRKDIRDMAERGYTTRQIASALDIHEATVAEIAKKEAISIHADRAVGTTRRLDSVRIIEHIVMDAETLTSDVNLIDLGDLPRERLAEWIAGLETSKKSLEKFIRQLKEQQKHGEAA